MKHTSQILPICHQVTGELFTQLSLVNMGLWDTNVFDLQGDLLQSQAITGSQV